MLREKLVKQIGADIVSVVDLSSHCPSYNILLIGVSGYLGTAILHQLMTISNIRLFVLMRCESPSHDMQRISSCLFEMN